MDNDLIVHLEEYKQLRAEILKRLELSNQVTSYAVAALAGGLALFSAHPDILLALAFLACWFWLLFLDHTSHVARMAQYIALVLAPQLSSDDKTVLGWEAHLRKVNAGELDLAGPTIPKAPKMGVSISMSVVFGGGAPVMLLVFWASQWPSQTPELPLYGRMIATGLIIGIWIYAVNRARLTALLRRNVNNLILSSG